VKEGRREREVRINASLDIDGTPAITYNITVLIDKTGLQSSARIGRRTCPP
jgi:hypothetical protein